MKPEAANRRSSMRLACALSVQYRTSGGWHPAAAIDLTEGGCRLRLGEDLPGSAPVSVRFETPIRDGATTATLEVRGTVVWCRKQGLSNQAGIHFTEPAKSIHGILGTLESAG